MQVWLAPSDHYYFGTTWIGATGGLGLSTSNASIRVRADGSAEGVPGHGGGVRRGFEVRVGFGLSGGQ
jgi:hypothetical protein